MLSASGLMEKTGMASPKRQCSILKRDLGAQKPGLVDDGANVQVFLGGGGA